MILNGRIVNPYQRSEAVLKEGDEVAFFAYAVWRLKQDFGS